VPQELQVNVAVINRSAGGIIINVQDFTSRMRIVLDPANVPLSVRWIPPPLSSDSLGAAGQLRLAAGEGSAFQGIVRAVSGSFAPGRYKLRVTLAHAMSTIVSEAGQRLAPRADAMAFLTMLGPENALEQTVAYRWAGRVALEHHRLGDAERLSKLAVESDPARLAGLYELGHVHLERKEYQEAAKCFERLLAVPRKELGYVPQLLAEAYVGLGDDAAATRALERLGFRKERIASELARLRQIVSRR
jgi:tetratricopeptide (TPR) repeat protein